MIVSTKDSPIYQVLYVCPEKYADGHLKYHVRCKVCGYETDKRKWDVEHTFVCQHTNYLGVITADYTWKNRKLSSVYSNMMQRCYSEKDPDYKNYGGKGITICDDWIYSEESFETWMLDNGYTDGMSIDRIDPDKGYSPDNCRVIQTSENSRYKSTTNYLDVDGTTKSGRKWSEDLMLGPNMVNTLLRKYGEDTTKDFIRKRIENPGVMRGGSRSWLDAYQINT